MKISPIIIGLLFATSTLAQATDSPARTNQLFNFGWKFKAGEIPDAENPTLDDSDWRKLDLPHDFQIEQPWDKTASRARGFKAPGAGWYRKSFPADANWVGKQVLLDFEGIMVSGEVWVNGKKIGGTDYGYLGFEADIADIIKYDAPNVVAVRAATGGNARWYTGGGLFRDVHLVVKDKISIARHGIYITTPVISDQNAEVGIQVEVGGFRNKLDELEIATTIYAPDGKPVGEARTRAPKNTKLARWAMPRLRVAMQPSGFWSILRMTAVISATTGA